MHQAIAVPEGYVAKIAICVARKNGDKVLDQMDRLLEPITIEGDDLRTLLVRSTRYTCDALTSIGDPGNGVIAVALDAAVLAGTRLEGASEGEIALRD